MDSIDDPEYVVDLSVDATDADAEVPSAFTRAYPGAGGDFIALARLAPIKPQEVADA